MTNKNSNGKADADVKTKARMFGRAAWRRVITSSESSGSDRLRQNVGPFKGSEGRRGNSLDADDALNGSLEARIEESVETLERKTLGGFTVINEDEDQITAQSPELKRCANSMGYSPGGKESTDTEEEMMLRHALIASLEESMRLEGFSDRPACSDSNFACNNNLIFGAAAAF